MLPFNERIWARRSRSANPDSRSSLSTRRVRRLDGPLARRPFGTSQWGKEPAGGCRLLYALVSGML